MKSDIEIAESAKLKPIAEIARGAKIPASALIPYGNYTAKLSAESIKPVKQGKLILVTAMNPTALGEGKTTVSIGLADAMKRIGLNVMLALREPSLGPVFGLKGGATGGGRAQVAPMANINLHFTGDMHAITAANNLLSAMIDNHIHWGNALKLKTVTWKRCTDCNDRALRAVTVGLGGEKNGVPRDDGFNITAASEIMAILCLSRDLEGLKRRLSKIVIGYNKKDIMVTAGELKAHEAMAVLLKDALKPNLVQTLEWTPALIHCGPFANIAHGCNSLIATLTALKLADYVVTEAGVGADLGAEKFLDIKCRNAALTPSAVVIVATVKALKLHGGVDASELSKPDCGRVANGLPNLLKHVDNIQSVFGLRCAVALNKYESDAPEEIQVITDACRDLGVGVAVCEVWEKGGVGGESLANMVKSLADKPLNKLQYAYELSDPIADKIVKIARRVYGAKNVVLTPGAKKEADRLTEAGFAELPVCIAKTQYSLSDNAGLSGKPEGFTFTVRELQLRAGAGFIVAVSGDIMLMPGLPRVPNAEGMTIDAEGNIKGLF
ncbi:MAG: formate--tetrahydrofolate ligase [Clostridiales bacterium]|jgi:formate--tetrahydrofolate ligase|nr:formate--tetrahydrofolate ligase [Clostridiales bacterium]